VELQIYLFLASALNGSEWSTSYPSRFTPGREAPVPVEQEADRGKGLDDLEKKMSSPAGIQTPDHPVRSLVTIPTTLSRLLQHGISVNGLCLNSVLDLLPVRSMQDNLVCCVLLMRSSSMM
jgi:hypothetical protein